MTAIILFAAGIATGAAFKEQIYSLKGKTSRAFTAAKAAFSR